MEHILFTASDYEPSDTIREYSYWTPQLKAALAYTVEGVGHGGSSIFRATLIANPQKVIDISGQSFNNKSTHIALAKNIGLTDEDGEKWFDSGWLYPWEESGRIWKRLKSSGYSWLIYTDDYPSRAITWLALREVSATVCEYMTEPIVHAPIGADISDVELVEGEVNKNCPMYG